MTTKFFHRSAAVMATVVAIIISLVAILPLMACGKAAVEIEKLNKDTLALTVGSSQTLNCIYTRELDEGETVEVEWTSDKTSVATVAAGKVTAVAAGTATITATLGNSSATCTVTVTDKYEVTIDNSSITLDVDGVNTATITATVKKNGAALEGAIEWTTSDATVATVANGVVTALKAGNATITASSNGAKATCAVVVKSSNAPYEVQAGSSNANVAKDPGVWYYFAKTSSGVATFEGTKVERSFSDGKESITMHFDNITILNENGRFELYLRYMPVFEIGSKYKVSFTFESNTAGRFTIGETVAEDVEAGTPVKVDAELTVTENMPMNINLYFSGDNIDIKLTEITFTQA